MRWNTAQVGRCWRVRCDVAFLKDHFRFGFSSSRLEMVVGMRVFLILALIAITLAEDQLENERKKKVFSLFSVVTFPNE